LYVQLVIPWAWVYKKGLDRLSIGIITLWELPEYSPDPR